ncbi:cupin domain-containing protein [Pelagibius sp. Alg239-R121]|uniref:cupin domain-containing protein n=1 Tax=Pelagibius sp. Alg239-R121 TaxID=2993448 RepID=UPI0024A71A4C|nr:cupin domain-containing protein [Pelagibius sp. Alg239-R121]
MIKNFLDAAARRHMSSHEGEGLVELYELWGRADFKSNVDFMDRVVVPPKSTVGYHRHGNNEEMYIVLEGQGTMTIGTEPTTVKKGDMILNPPGGAHGLVNDTDADIDLLIIQLGLQEKT